MSRLIEVRGPSAQEADQGAEIVFVREDGGVNSYIKACWTDGSYQQWGATTRVLGDNVEAVRLWAEGITAVHELIRDAEDGQTDEQIATDAGYQVVFKEDDTTGNPYTLLNPDGEDLAYCQTEDDAWAAGCEYAEGRNG